MSEFINNVTQRKETLKNVLRKLHEGQPVEAVLAEFGELARQASSTEIAQIEQMLVDEGMPVEEIQRLCDVHVAVFREGLNQQAAPETLPGHPVYTFRAENKMALGILNGLKVKTAAYCAAPEAEKLESTRVQLRKLMEYERHYTRKENLLFPYLERYGFTGPSKVMWGIHDQIRAMMKRLLALLEQPLGESLEAITALHEQLDQAVRDMFYKEDKILLPAALNHLSLQDWADMRAQEPEIGYFMTRPGSQWPAPPAPASAEEIHRADGMPAHVPGHPVADSEASMPEASAPEAATPLPGQYLPGQIPTGLLPLDTGALSLEQINLLLCNLPVDMTYVDENDEVRYFSQGRERIFPRLPAIIGRKVQNCHPPQSVDRVQNILDDFRAGRRDTAEFWIQMHGKFIHIRYFALRDGRGSYRGTLEVSQDISAIRALQGERRLLDDSPATQFLAL